MDSDTAGKPVPDDGERDVKLLRTVLRNTLAAQAASQHLTRDDATNMASDDIAAIGYIKDAQKRNDALLAAGQSRQALGDYKAEFDRQAPALVAEVDAAAVRNRVRGEVAALLEASLFSTRVVSPTPVQFAPTVSLVKPVEPTPAPPPPTPAQSSDPGRRTKAYAFVNQSPESVLRKYPDLAPAYGTLIAAIKFAERNFPGYEDQFFNMANEYIVGQILSGEPVMAPMLGFESRKNEASDRRRTEDVLKESALQLKLHLIR